MLFLLDLNSFHLNSFFHRYTSLELYHRTIHILGNIQMNSFHETRVFYIQGIYVWFYSFFLQRIWYLECTLVLSWQVNNNLEQQAKAIYRQMFAASSSSEWTQGTLSDIAEITMGQSPSGSSYNEDGVGTVFYQGRAEFGCRFPTQRLCTTEPKRMARENDVLLSVRAPVGDLNVAREYCCIGRGLASIRSKHNRQSFVLYTVFALQPEMDKFNGEGTVFGSINRDSLNKMAIIIPTDDEMDRFESLVSPMDAQIRANHEEILRLEAIRAALLPKLMTGELDVSNIEY